MKTASALCLDFSTDVTFVDVFEKQSTRLGDKLAAHCGGKSISYRDLNVSATRLARLLHVKGVQKSDRVVVAVPPSLEILIAILALHKLGAVYVPLDPGFPANRIAVILAEVEPRYVLGLADNSFLPVDARDLFIDLAAPTDVAVEINPEVSLSPSDISHIYFTSGTTGKPKGVVADHGNLLHYVTSAVERYGFGETDHFIAAARYTFSISLFELLVPLAAGAEITLLSRDQVLDMQQLSAAVSRATVFHFGPSLLKQLLPYIEQHYQSFAAFDHVHHASSGGDMVPPEILEKLKAIFRKAEVFVIYGSSEISCMGCTYEAPRAQKITRTKVGKAFGDMQVCILDEQLNPVDSGEVGNLYFSGPGLVTGYLNQPVLTAEKFIELDGLRFYAIGDVGRADENGNIELLGRADFQVQIRGMRVELLEIEHHLKSLPAVADCVVVARQHGEDSDQTLVAYLVIRDGEPTSAAYFADYLKQYLPDYTIPGQFVRLKKLPLNHNGKLDRSQLPAPDANNLLLTGSYQAPETEVQRGLLAMLQSLFNVDGIGIDHDFFELGGDSLTAVRYLMEVDKQFGRFIPIPFLLEHPTIRQLAEVIENKKPVTGVGDVVVLKHGNSEPPLFCLYGVLLYRDLALSLDTPRTVCGVYLEEEMLLLQPGVDVAEVQALHSVDQIARRYLRSITTFQTHGPYYLAGESFGGIIALEVARLLREQGEEVHLVAMLDSMAPGFWQSLSQARKLIRHLKKILRERRAYLNRSLLRKIKNKIFKSRVGPAADQRANARALASSTYHPETFSEPVVLFKAKERTEFELESADLGWGRFLSRLTVHEVSGDHLGMLQEGTVQDLAAKLRPYL